MKKIILLQIMILCCTHSSFSQSGWVQLNTETTKSLSASYFLNPNTGFVVGDSGIILRTTNEGLNWNSNIINSYYWFNSIIFIDNNTGYICGNSYYSMQGILYKTTNGGINWNVIYQDSVNFLNNIYFFNQSTGFIVGYNGVILKTTDSGLSWNKLNSGTIYPIRSICFLNPNIGYAVGGMMDIMGMIMKTTNGGLSWNNQTVSSETLYSFSFTDNQTGFAVGGDPEFGVTFFKTSNGGINWISQNQQQFGIIHCIKFTSLDTGYCTGFNFNGVSKTINGGNNWFTQYVCYNSIPENIFMLNSTTGFVVGSNGLILKTTNGGYIPVDTISPKYFPLEMGNVWVYNWQYMYYIGGGKGTVRLKIVNSFVANGKRYFGFQTTMTNSQGSSCAYSLDSLRIDSVSGNLYRYVNNSECLFDSLNAKLNDTCRNLCQGYIVLNDTLSANIFGQTRQTKKYFISGPDGYTSRKYSKDIGLYYHYDSGLQWWCEYALQGCVINGVLYGDTTTYYTVSGTVTYQDNNQTVSSGYVKVLKLDKNTYQIITLDSTGIQSNGSYTLSHVPHDSTYIMAYADDEEFVPTYHDSTINWQNAAIVYPANNLSNVNIKVFRITQSPGQMHIGGGVFTSSFSLSGLEDAIVYAKNGNQYNRFSISSSTGSFRVDSLQQGSYQIICDRLGYTSQTKNVSVSFSSQDTVNFYLVNIIAVKKEGFPVPTSFKLYQNYPNPFNPSTTIKFDIPLLRGVPEGQGVFTKLIIYDLIGQKVATLVNENLNPGIYKVDWNASNYASGLYLYKLTAGDFTEMKKLVLLK